MTEAKRRTGWTRQVIRLLLGLTIVWLVSEGLFGMTGWSNGLSTISRNALGVWLIAAPIVAIAFVIVRIAGVPRNGARDLALLADGALGALVVALWVAILIKGAFFTVWL